MGLTIGLWDSRVEELDGHVAVVAGFARTVGPQDGLLRSHFKGAAARAVTVAANNQMAVGQEVEAGHILNRQTGFARLQFPQQLMVGRPLLDLAEAGDVDVALFVRDGGKGETGHLLRPDGTVSDAGRIAFDNPHARTAHERAAIGQTAHHAQRLVAVAMVERHLDNVALFTRRRHFKDASRAILANQRGTIG